VPIQRAFDFANEQIKSLVFQELQLVKVFESMKKFYFLEVGDFFQYFMDAAEPLLLENCEGVQADRIQSLLEISLQSSSANADVFRDNLFVEIESLTLLEKVSS